MNISIHSLYQFFVCRDDTVPDTDTSREKTFILAPSFKRFNLLWQGKFSEVALFTVAGLGDGGYPHHGEQENLGTMTGNLSGLP